MVGPTLLEISCNTYLGYCEWYGIIAQRAKNSPVDHATSCAAQSSTTVELFIQNFITNATASIIVTGSGNLRKTADFNYKLHEFLLIKIPSTAKIPRRRSKPLCPWEPSILVSNCKDFMVEKCGNMVPTVWSPCAIRRHVSEQRVACTTDFAMCKLSSAWRPWLCWVGSEICTECGQNVTLIKIDLVCQITQKRHMSHPKDVHCNFEIVLALSRRGFAFQLVSPIAITPRPWPVKCTTAPSQKRPIAKTPRYYKSTRISCNKKRWKNWK